MTPKQIGKAYDTLTHLWESEDFNQQNGIEQHKLALKFTSNKGTALDVGCGCTGRFIDLLQQHGFAVEGLDISEKMITLAQQRHPGVTFYHQDICQWPLKSNYDFITAWDSIWHIPLEQQKPVLTKLVNALNSNGVLIFSFGGTEQASSHTDDFMGAKVYYSSLGTNGFVNVLTDLGCVIKHLEYDQYPELHSYLIVQKHSN